MKNRILTVILLFSARAAVAEGPHDASAVVNTNQVLQPTNSVTPGAERRTPEQAEQRQKKLAREDRRLLLMDRELKRIGVTEEEKIKVNELQKLHKQKMTANAERISAAREKLARLMDAGAPMEALEAAIDEISAAQADQLRILVYNRIEMERILGKDKYDEFMKNARKQFQKHGRRGGPPLPPRPGLPPKPGHQSTMPAPPENPVPPENPAP